MKKRLFAGLLATMMVSFMMVTTAFATGPDELEVGPHPGQPMQVKEVSLTQQSYDAIIDNMVQEHIQNYELTEADSLKAQEILGLYDDTIMNVQGEATVASSFDDNWVKLRYGNLIELTLDLNEGISETVVLSCTNISRDAEDVARNNFSDNQDSAQHFIWNFMMTDEQDKMTARTVAINHEWGISMITPMLNCYEDAYNKYIGKGYSENSASNKAIAETITYIPEFKYDAVCIMEKSYEFFEKFFTNDCIMDLWNNCYGRAYPEKGYTDEVKAFKESAFVKKELILDGKNSMAENVTTTHKKHVWSTDWYSYGKDA